MLDFKLCRSLEAYIRKHYIEEKKLLFSQYCLTTELEKDTKKSSVKENVCCYIWPEFIPQPDKNTFSSKLFHLIEKKGLEDVEVYKKANIDRKLFSKLRKNDYHPSKKIVIALALALQLNLDEATDLLRYAEYALSPNDKADVIISFCFTKPVYDIFTVNELLYKYAGTSL